MIDRLSISYKMGGFLIESDDGEVDPDTTYYADTYSEVQPSDDDFPNENGWYEIVDGLYHLTTDAEPVEGKLYYEASIQEVQPEEEDVPSELGWYEMVEPETYTELKSTMTIVSKPETETVIV